MRQSENKKVDGRFWDAIIGIMWTSFSILLNFSEMLNRFSTSIEKFDDSLLNDTKDLESFHMYVTI